MREARPALKPARPVAWSASRALMQSEHQTRTSGCGRVPARFPDRVPDGIQDWTPSHMPLRSQMLLDGTPGWVADGTPGRVPSHMPPCLQMLPAGTLGRVASGVRPGLRVHMLKANHSVAKQRTAQQSKRKAEQMESRAEPGHTFKIDV